MQLAHAATTQAPLLKNGYFHNTGKLKLSILQYISNKKTN